MGALITTEHRPEWSDNEKNKRYLAELLDDDLFVKESISWLVGGVVYGRANNIMISMNLVLLLHCIDALKPEIRQMCAEGGRR
jgi:hypothetical protein